jgi:potassium-transporting ATPase KdpC subunit
VTNALRSSVVIFVVLTLITGVAYPLVVTLVAQTVFPHQANGSLVQPIGENTGEKQVNIRDWWGKGREAKSEVQPIGSELIGQQFSSDRYFWSRPSATSPTPYHAAASTGSNYGPTNPSQLDAVKTRVEALRKVSHDEKSPVPIDLVTASGSGLDPHISPAAAEYQVPRVARARNISEYEVRRVIAENVENRTLGLLGEPRVNVLRINLAIDEMEQPATKTN